MTCPTPVAGSVTNTSGQSFVDAYSFEQGVPQQGQLWAWLSSVSGTADRFRKYQIVKGERTLRTIQVKGWLNDPTKTTPLPYTTGTFEIGKTYDGSGNAYTGTIPDGSEVHTCSAYYQVVSANSCGYKDNEAIGGWYRWDMVWDYSLPETEQVITGAYELVFSTGTLAGEFVAPRCVMTGCPPRPSKSSCI